MVVIRLARGGAKKKPFYKMVVADRRAPRDGRFIEQLGFFNPVARGSVVRLEINQDRLDYWLQQGAKVSDRVKSLITEWRKKPAA